MTPQGNFMVAAAITAGHEPELRSLLETMNSSIGVVDPDNGLVPFGLFDKLHVARFVILQDDTIGDLSVYQESFPHAPLWLAFLGDCDGEGALMLAEIASACGDGLRQIFSHCIGFDGRRDLLDWMTANALAPAAQYVNWVGRTVRQIHEERALHQALRAWLQQQGSELGQSPGDIRRRLLEYHRAHGPALTPPEPTPSNWRLGHWLHLIGGIVILIVLSPAMLLLAPFFLAQLRQRETVDPVIAPRPTPVHVASLSVLEDRQPSNQFSAFGTVKPGRFRRWTLICVFWLLDFGTTHIYTRGRLARVGTIHFARWVFLDDRRRLFFGSNYDGSLDSYMDDFINKVAFGLNLVFSNGIGYPRTSWLLAGGAKHEQPFKNFLRRHQIPTQVWYKAYPTLTAADLARNTLIREGLERGSMRDDEARTWLALI